MVIRMELDFRCSIFLLVNRWHKNMIVVEMYYFLLTLYYAHITKALTFSFKIFR